MWIADDPATSVHVPSNSLRQQFSTNTWLISTLGAIVIFLLYENWRISRLGTKWGFGIKHALENYDNIWVLFYAIGNFFYHCFCVHVLPQINFYFNFFQHCGIFLSQGNYIVMGNIIKSVDFTPIHIATCIKYGMQIDRQNLHL